MKVELDGNTVCGVHCLHYLARREGPARIPEIARAGGMGSDRVRRTLRALSARGLADFRRRGGWSIGRPIGEISVGDVAEAMRGLPTSGRACRIEYETCPFRGVCALTPVCRALQEVVRSALGAANLGEMASDVPSKPPCTERRSRGRRPR